MERTAEHPAGCKPQCRPGTYSVNGIYPCHSCKEGYTTKRWGEKTCHRINEEDKGCPEGMKWLSNENGEGYCIKDTPCPRMYYSRDGSAPCMRCPEGTTTFTTGAKYCSDEPDEPSTDDNTTDDYTDDAPYDDDETHNSENVEKCPYGTMWVEKDSVKGCRPLCKLDYYSETGASPCEECSSGKTTTYVGATSCVDKDPDDNCKYGEKRVQFGNRFVCRAECGKNTWSENGVEPCIPCKAGYSTEGIGATTCVNVISGGDPEKTCPEGTKYVEKPADDGTSTRGCIPLCDVDYYSSTGAYPCKRCAHGTSTKAKGSIGEDSCVTHGEDHDVDKCPEGMKWYNDEGRGYCIVKELCPRMYYSSDGYAPCSKCNFGTTSNLHGSTKCEPVTAESDDGGDDDGDEAKCREGEKWIYRDEKEFVSRVFPVPLDSTLTMVSLPAPLAAKARPPSKPALLNVLTCKTKVTAEITSMVAPPVSLVQLVRNHASFARRAPPVMLLSAL